MKCQKCEKPATFHITDLTGKDGLLELHLCPECAKQYLQTNEKEQEAPKISGVLSSQLKLEQTAEDLKDCLLYTSPSPRDQRGSRMPSSA